MAKKKPAKKDISPPSLSPDDGLQVVFLDDLADIPTIAEFFTHLIAVVNPKVDKGETFNYLMDAFQVDPADISAAMHYGELIRNTSSIDPTKSKTKLH